MTENELLLLDRIQVIQSANKKYDLENNAHLSFSGGKDSTILHYLLDMALPNNKIPRVYSDTGIEYQLVRQFVYELAKTDDRIKIIKPAKPITKMLQEVGYPFKSKYFAGKVATYNKCYQTVDKWTNTPPEQVKEYMLSHKEEERNMLGSGIGVIYYLHDLKAVRDKDGYVIDFEGAGKYCHPKVLEHLFTQNSPLKVSHLCCHELKKAPIAKWEKENNRHVAITGLRKEEKGGRENIKTCILTDSKGNLEKFHPLLVVSDEWEEWFIAKNNIKLAKMYYPPYNFSRTGCKGCPFAITLQNDLEVMNKLLPNERKQCEIIWKPVYDEYRRLGYRLHKEGEGEQLTLFDED